MEKHGITRRNFLAAAAAATAAPTLLSSAAFGKERTLKPVPDALIEKIGEALPEKATAKPKKSRKVLIFWRCNGFFHGSIPTGNEALKGVSADSPALIILDVGLPDVSGFDVCRELRRQYNTPIIFLTARKDDIDQVLGLELGADDYIVKPFSPRVLTARIRARLRNAENALPKQETSGDTDPIFSVNKEAQSITLSGTRLDLSRYEYRILQLLISHPGRIYSRSQLMDLVWEEPDRSYDRTVDTHIKTIRQKITAIDGNCDPIKTHRGMGYSFQQ